MYSIKFPIEHEFISIEFVNGQLAEHNLIVHVHDNWKSEHSTSDDTERRELWDLIHRALGLYS